MQSLELLLDDDLDRTVRAAWDALAAAGLPSQASHRSPSNRPHVTLAVRDAIDTTRVDASGLPIPIALGPLVVLGRDPRWVLARSALPSPALVALHSGLHASLGTGDDAPHTAPGSWTPHVTLARGLAADDLSRALMVVHRTEDASGRAVSIRHWDAVARRETALG